MADKKRLAIYLDPDLYDILEKERGLVKRSTYIENLVKEKLDPEKETES